MTIFTFVLQRQKQGIFSFCKWFSGYRRNIREDLFFFDLKRKQGWHVRKLWRKTKWMKCCMWCFQYYQRLLTAASVRHGDHITIKYYLKQNVCNISISYFICERYSMLAGFFFFLKTMVWRYVTFFHPYPKMPEATGVFFLEMAWNQNSRRADERYCALFRIDKENSIAM